MLVALLIVSAFAVALGTACLLLWRGRRRALTTVSSVADTTRPEPPRARVARLSFASSSQEWLGIELAGAQQVADWRPVSLPPAVQGQMGGLLTSAPLASLAASTLGARDGTYILTFSPEIQEQLEVGTAHLLQAGDGGWYGAAHDGHRIVEQGVLESAGSGTASILTAAWGVMALVSAQKHLLDISQSMREITGSVGRIEG